MRSTALWLVLGAWASMGCGATPQTSETTESTAGPIAGGTLDFNDSAVFQEITHYPSEVSLCTASLIAPNVLLTARHCISPGGSAEVVCGKSPFGAPVAGRETVATNAAEPDNTSTFYHGADVRVPSTGADLCGFDVALIILDTPVPAAQATPLVPRIDRPVTKGESYRAVGYGVNADGDQNPGRMALGGQAIACVPGQCSASVAVTEFVGDTGICSGDSGGPALDTEGKIIGVVSRGSDPCATPVYGQVEPWADFITSTVLEAAASGGYQAPFWAFSGSSDRDPTLSSAGDACSDSSECAPGTVCYYEGDPSDALCTQVCQNDAQCGTGQQCQQGFDVQGGGLCFNPAKPAAPPDETPDAGAVSPKSKISDDSCAITPRRNSSPASAWLLLALTVASAIRLKTSKRSRA